MLHACRVQVSGLPARELVPGDVVELHVGDRVPADVRVTKLKTATLRAEQASLTGESVAVLKRLEAVEEEGCELQAKVRQTVPAAVLPACRKPHRQAGCGVLCADACRTWHAWRQAPAGAIVELAHCAGCISCWLLDEQPEAG